MSSFNKVIIMGNLTRDPDVRVTAHDLSICKFSMAVNRRFTRKDGEAGEEVCFVDVVAFARQAEVLGDHLQKGTPILVEGRLKQESWEDKNTGHKRSKIVVNLESFSFIGPKEKDESEDGSEETRPAQVRTQPQREARQAATAHTEPDADEDLPF